MASLGPARPMSTTTDRLPEISTACWFAATDAGATSTRAARAPAVATLVAPARTGPPGRVAAPRPRAPEPVVPRAHDPAPCPLVLQELPQVAPDRTGPVDDCQVAGFHL